MRTRTRRGHLEATVQGGVLVISADDTIDACAPAVRADAVRVVVGAEVFEVEVSGLQLHGGAKRLAANVFAMSTRRCDA